MLKDFFIVGLGSFFGGGARFVVSKIIQSWTVLPFPLGTFAVNVLGCLLIGFFSAVVSSFISPDFASWSVITMKTAKNTSIMAASYH